MLRPERMTLANIFLLREDSASVTRALAEMEAVEVFQSRAGDEAAGLGAFDLGAAETALEGLRARVSALAQILGVERRSVPQSRLRVDPEHIADKIEEEFQGLEARARDLNGRLAARRADRERLDVLAWIVAALQREGLDAATMNGSPYVSMDLGAVPRAGFYRLQAAAELGGHKVFSLGSFADKEFVAAVATPDRRDDLAGGLNAARFERVTLLEEFFEGGRLSTNAVEMRMWQAREDVTETGLEMAELARERAADITRWRAEIDVNARLLDSMTKYLGGAYSAFVTGWIPSRRVAAVRERLTSLTGGKVEVVTADAGDARDGGHEHSGPPVSLSNPRLVRPFEFLVGLYGLPAYNGIDPTALLAVTFVFLFGAMFGDVGQGLVLVTLGALGVWAFRRTPGSAKAVGGIMIWCGLSAVVFGFLYGSVFGREDILQPLWLRPMEHILPMLVIGISVGALILTLGMVVNVTQHLLVRNYKDALFGEWAGSTIVFYLGVMFLFFLIGIGRADLVRWWVIILVLVPPLAATMFGAEVWDRAQGKSSGEGAADVMSKALEIALGSLANTMSFARVPAFALNHAALMSSVFLIATMFKGSGGVTGMLISKTDVVLGNILVIGMEGLVVFIQVMRLHYYEFFGKFLHHQGRPFAPLSLTDRRSVA